MKVSEKQKKKHYELEKRTIKRIPLDVQKKDYAKIKTHADNVGESVNGYIKKSIAMRMETEDMTNKIDTAIFESEKEMDEGGQSIALDDAFENLEKKRRNKEYLAMLDRSIQQAKEGKVVVKTMEELEEMEKEWVA